MSLEHERTARCERIGVPVENAMPRQVLKPVMARMSSKLPAAMSKKEKQASWEDSLVKSDR